MVRRRWFPPLPMRSIHLAGFLTAALVTLTNPLDPNCLFTLRASPDPGDPGQAANLFGIAVSLTTP